MLDIGTFEELQSRIDFHGFVDNQLEDEEENDEREVEAKNNSKNSTINKMREGVDIAKLTRTGSTIGKEYINYCVLCDRFNFADFHGGSQV